MTCIVAVKQLDKTGKVDHIILGADNIMTSVGVSFPRAQSKLLNKGSIAFGFAGLPRLREITEHDVVFPSFYVDQTIDNYIFRLVEIMRKKFIEYDTINVSPSSSWSGEIIVYKDRVFRVGTHFNIHESSLSFTTLGSGEDYAAGAIWASSKKKSAREKAELGLLAAAEFVQTVAGPFDFMKIDSQGNITNE